MGVKASAKSFLRNPRTASAAKVIQSSTDEALLAVLKVRDELGKDSSAFRRLGAAYLLANDRLAADFAGKIRRKSGATHVDQEDLEQAAREGMWQALLRFDLKKAQRFSSFAYWWMVNGCQDLLHSSRDDRVEKQHEDVQTAPGVVLGEADFLRVAVAQLCPRDQRALVFAGDIPADDNDQLWTERVAPSALVVALARARLRRALSLLGDANVPRRGDEAAVVPAPVPGRTAAAIMLAEGACRAIQFLVELGADLPTAPPVSRPRLTVEQVHAARAPVRLAWVVPAPASRGVALLF